MNKLINALGFQACWWICVTSVAYHFELQAVFFCLFCSLIHFYFSSTPCSDFKVAMFVWVTGLFVDSCLQHFSVISFYGWALGSLSPFWLWALWFTFALTLNSSLAFLKELSTLLVSLLGFVAGPFTYYAGAQIGAAQMDESSTQVIAIAIVWMIVLPLFVYVAKHLTYTTTEKFK